jgi:hypothetical protein
MSLISDEPSILKSTVLPFFTKTLVQMAWQGRGLIKQGVKPGNATNIYNAHILAT